MPNGTELDTLLCTTPISTFEGANVVYDVLRHGLEDSGSERLIKDGLYTLFMFLSSVDSALSCHGLREQVEFWFWRHQCPSAQVWHGHPRQPVGLRFWEQRRAANEASS